MNTILELKDISKTFTKKNTLHKALDDVSFTMKEGECLGIVGESGSGKSTVAKIITCLERPDNGSIYFKGKDITGLTRKERKKLYKNMQLIFQMPVDSFNPRIKLGSSIIEGMLNQGISKSDAKLRMYGFLDLVGIPREYALKYPHEVSGGECQRAAIARAIMTSPDLLICDEVTSALDVTVQKQIIELLDKLKKEQSMSYLFISHDIALVQLFCDRVLVMYQGQIVEEGTVDQVIMNPKKEYTKKLIDAVLL